MSPTSERRGRGWVPFPAVLAVLLLVGCGAEATGESLGDASEATGECAAGTRPFEHSAGSTCVPDRPQRVVTLQDQNALLPLWELGFRDVVGSAGAFDEDGEPFFRRMQAYDTSQVEFVGDYGEPNVEAVAALEPDLIVGPPDLESYEQLSALAPTVLIDTFDAPIAEVSMRFAELVGAEEQSRELEAEYRQRLEELGGQVGDPGEVVVSVIVTSASGGAEPGQFYVDGAGGSVEEVLDEVGFARPEAQATATERTYFSVEQLPTQDADLLLRMTFQQAQNEELNTEAVLGSPLWEQLNAVRLGQAHDVDGETTVGSAYQSRFAFIDVLSQHLQGLDTSGDLPQVEVMVP